MDSSSNHMTCLLKIESPIPEWKKFLEKLLKTINDVSFMIDKRSKTVYVSGKIDPQILREKMSKAGQNVVIVWSNFGPKPEQYRKDHLMEHMNAPPHYWMNQPPQQPYNHAFAPSAPPDYWMNQPPQQPYNHAFAPPPYVHLSHPQPPPPPPYKFQQTEPVAKSFPATPPPPKNFTMGDLQCKIM